MHRGLTPLADATVLCQVALTAIPTVPEDGRAFPTCALIWRSMRAAGYQVTSHRSSSTSMRSVNVPFVHVCCLAGSEMHVLGVAHHWHPDIRHRRIGPSQKDARTCNQSSLRESK